LIAGRPPSRVRSLIALAGLALAGLALAGLALAGLPVAGLPLAGEKAQAAPTPAAGPILSEPPPSPDPAREYLFYLHGRIVQEQGRKAVSPDYGPYEYDAILRGLASAGFVVISEVRPRGTGPPAYADRVVAQIRRLLKAGVPPRRITVVGASMGGFIGMLVSSRLPVADIGYVLMGSCDSEMRRALKVGLHGDVLSVIEASDDASDSCSSAIASDAAAGRHADVRINTGLRHGFLFRALPDWMGPAVRWARERRV